VRGILERRRAENWTPPPPKPAPQPAARKAAAEPSGPPSLLLPEQLAELLRQWGDGDRTIRRIMAGQIQGAIRQGIVPPELMASIPTEILAGLEVPAAVSGS
jgi:hypothetical protein